MKASEAYRIMAQVAERSGSENLSGNLIASAVAHMAIDLNMSREEILQHVDQVYNIIRPGISASKDAASKLTSADATDVEKLIGVAEAGMGAILEHQSKGKPKS